MLAYAAAPLLAAKCVREQSFASSMTDIAILCTGINRHEVEDERALRGRPSEPPRPRVLREPYREVGREA
jgi:hypothetical protein